MIEKALEQLLATLGFQNAVTLCMSYNNHSLLCCQLQVEALLASEDYGKDLASVNNLLKKHQLLEADISAHEVSRVTAGVGGGVIRANLKSVPVC